MLFRASVPALSQRAISRITAHTGEASHRLAPRPSLVGSPGASPPARPRESKWCSPSNGGHKKNTPYALALNH